MGFFSAVKKFFSGADEETKVTRKPQEPVQEGVRKPDAAPESGSAEPAAPPAGPSEASAAAAEPAGEAEVRTSGAAEPASASAGNDGKESEGSGFGGLFGRFGKSSSEPVPASPAPEAAPEARPAEPAAEPSGPQPEADVSQAAPAGTAVPVREKPGSASSEDTAMTLALRQAPPRLSAWLDVVLEGVDRADDLLWKRLAFLLRSLETPPSEAETFINDFRGWLERMEYRYLEDFRSELQYRLAIALDMEDEEDERDRLFAKLQDGLAKTRARFGQGLAALISGHSELDRAFWEEMEELFIMADMGAEPSLALVEKLRSRARAEGISTPDALLPLLEQEVEALFKVSRRISAVNPPEIVLMVGVNGVGKTTTIAKLAYRARSEGKKVLIAAADTFRAAAVEQLEVWADRIGADFHSKGMGADPAAVAFEAMDKALKGGYDIVFIDTAGRLHTKSNLMEELHKIRMVVERKHPGAPHRTVLVIDATTGQNALQQTKMFRDTSGVNEIILTKLDGTAKGGVALAVASQFGLPITFIGLGEKMEDLRPFDAHAFARALMGRD